MDIIQFPFNGGVKVSNSRPIIVEASLSHAPHTHTHELSILNVHGFIDMIDITFMDL